jgi:predicted phage tail protein
MIYEFRNPIPVHSPLGAGMAIYVRDSGTFANDVWCVALEDGRIRHFRVDQLAMEANGTFNIGQPCPR